jgi:hypothetical protein
VVLTAATAAVHVPGVFCRPCERLRLIFACSGNINGKAARSSKPQALGIRKSAVF